MTVGLPKVRRPTFHGGKQLAAALFVLAATSFNSIAGLDDGLIAYYPFNGNANDASQNGVNGVMHGNPVFENGIQGSACRFDGTGVYITVPGFTFTPRNGFSVTLWARPDADSGTGQTRDLLSKHASPTELEFIIRTEADGRYDSEWRIAGLFHDLSTSVGLNDANGLVMPSFSAWDALAATYDGAAIRFYVNGSLIVTQPASGNISSTVWPLTIGAMASLPNWEMFKGLIDEVRLYHRALTSEEVLQLARPIPFIARQPTNQTVNAGAAVTLSVTANGNTPLSYQWRFNGQNIAGATNASFTVTNARASDSGSYSVRVANAAGSVVSATAHLAVLDDGARGTPPEQVTTRPVPPREPSQNNLVLITHGWQPLGQHATWVDEMANAIQARLTSESKVDWQVVPIHWNEAAWGLPVMALSGARIVGALYGAEFSQTQWQHIHLIAHSAGSVFIEAFAKEIKAVWPATDIHCTYLDPYLSIMWGLGRETYGQNADWSDSYFAADVTATLTRGKLVNAHNVEVTCLDPDARYMPIGGSLSSHGWPYRFYAQTVTGSVLRAGQYGFSLSKEAEGWEQRGDYPMNNSPVILPLHATLSPFQGETPFSAWATFAFDDIPLNTSGNGVSLIGSFSFSMSTTPILPIVEATRSLSPTATPPSVTTGTTEPAWLAIGATVTTNVNFVQFDAEFTSAIAAEGLLTIFWNTNQIGMIDERTSTAGLQTHRFELPSLMAEGVYTLSFRLDSYGSAESSVVISNVTTGLFGIVDPIVLGWVSPENNAWPTLEVTAPTGFTYLVQTSTNLIEWTPLGFHLQTNAVMQFVDPDSTNSRQRFYKALLP